MMISMKTDDNEMMINKNKKKSSLSLSGVNEFYKEYYFLFIDNMKL
jgi:hypothetical protein